MLDNRKLEAHGVENVAPEDALSISTIPMMAEAALPILLFWGYGIQPHRG
jgi:hypothetical protein